LPIKIISLVTFMKNWLNIGFLIALVVGMVIVSGCTSQTTSATVTMVPTPAAPASIVTTSVPVQPATSGPVMTTVATAPSKAGTTVPANNIVQITVNKAEKQTGFGMGTGNEGRVFLVFDVALKNNDKANDFKYTDSSFVLSFKGNSVTNTAVTTQFMNALTNPLVRGTVEAGTTDDGKILFNVGTGSSVYKLSVVDPSGKVLTSTDFITVP
jgi:hypothetical protein